MKMTNFQVQQIQDNTINKIKGWIRKAGTRPQRHPYMYMVKKDFAH